MASETHHIGVGTIKADEDAILARRILALLGLDRLAIEDQLVLCIQRFRTAQQTQLRTLLESMDASVLVHLASYFDRKLEVKDELERYTQDVLKMQSYIMHHNLDSAVCTAMMQLMASFGAPEDRRSLTKIFQTIGFSCASTFCDLCRRLPFKYQQDWLLLFTENELPLLKEWMRWLTKLSSRSSASQTSVMQFLINTSLERSTRTWMALLYPLTSSVRIAVIQQIVPLSAVTLRQLAKFYDTTGISVQKLLTLDVSVQKQLPMLLDVFPAVTLITIFTKFNSETSIRTIVLTLDVLARTDLLRLVDALASAEQASIELFLSAAFAYPRLMDLVLLFLKFAPSNQIRFLDLVVAASQAIVPRISQSSDQEEHETAIQSPCFLLFELFRNARFDSFDDIIHKLWMLPRDTIQDLVCVLVGQPQEMLSVLAEGVEAINSSCMKAFLAIVRSLPIDSHPIFVEWVKQVSDDAAMPVYDVLLFTKQQDHSEMLSKVLTMLSGLKLKDKLTLCNTILQRVPVHNIGIKSSTHSIINENDACLVINQKILFYLCDCILSQHKIIRLLALIPPEKREGLIFLLRTQRIPEQVALTRLMLSLSTEANCRLMDKISAFQTDTLDEFFQLLLLIPKVEYRTFAKLLVSVNVSQDQLQTLVKVAAALMNQASSREMVTFASDLLVPARHLFFDMLADPPEKGIVLRIVSCGMRLAPELLHEFMELLHQMTWTSRSSFLEQIRVLQDAQESPEQMIHVLRDLESDDRRVLVLLFNPLQLTVRITMLALLEQLPVLERHLTLFRLDKMPKSQVTGYCTSICDPLGANAVGAAVLQLLGHLDEGFQLRVLQWLRQEPCWYFLQTLANSDARCDDKILNAFAACLVLLHRESEYTLLRHLMQHAMDHAIRLDEFVVVIAEFRTHTALLAFLQYAAHFVRSVNGGHSATTLFRVLSKYTQTVFLFEMARMLDSDDTQYLLRRLDRSWERHQQTLDATMLALYKRCQGNFASVKDEFCNLIMGFRVRGLTSDKKSNGDRWLAPRIALDQQLSQAIELNNDNDDQISFEQALVSRIELASRCMPLGRLLKRTEKKLQLKRADWRTWQPETLTRAQSSPRISNNSPSPRETEAVDEQTRLHFEGHAISSEVLLPSVFELTANEVSSELEQTYAAQGYDCSSRPVSVQRETPLVLPLLSLPERRLLVKQSTENAIIKSESSSPLNNRSPALSRSESAPQALDYSYSIQPHDIPKRYRGLAAGMQAPVNFHVKRDRGVSIFVAQCEQIKARGSSRIRYSKTLAAYENLNLTRVQIASGQRQEYAISQKSPLARADRATIEQAKATLAAARQTREMQMLDFS